MNFITIHNTETEEVHGHIAATESEITASALMSQVYDSWREFDRMEHEQPQTIEDFVDWHNENYSIKIEICYGEYIQL